jgi:hypothetical protein
VFDIYVANIDQDVAKVDCDVVHVARTKYACCKPMFQVFQMFQTYVANVSSDVSKVDLGVAHVAMAMYAYFKCFICFRCMLQMFHLDVSK